MRAADARKPFLEVLADCERLVLLGDVLELRHGPAHRALEAARPALSEIAATLGASGEVVIVPGNHDHQLVAPWLERRAAAAPVPALQLESDVDWREGESLAALAGALEPARVRAAYPGVWLREHVYATHGHYTDRHNTVPLLERLGAGLVARIVGERGAGPAVPDDYEGALAPMYAFIDAVVRRRPPTLDQGSETFQVRSWGRLSARGGRSGVRRAALKGGFAVAVAGLNRAGLGPLRAELSGVALREGGLYGARLMAERLAIPAEHVIFGHTHRAGPLPGRRSRPLANRGGSAAPQHGFVAARALLPHLGAAGEPLPAGILRAPRRRRRPQARQPARRGARGRACRRTGVLRRCPA